MDFSNLMKKLQSCCLHHGSNSEAEDVYFSEIGILRNYFYCLQLMY